MILLKFCLWVRHSCNNKIKQSLSKFFFLSQFVNWVAWGQARSLAWGSWYVSIVSTFPNSFALVLDSNLHDLNGTNLDWRCFQQNCLGVIFVQKSKFSKRPENLRRLFLENMKNTCTKIHLRGWTSGPQDLPPPPPGGGCQACGAHVAMPPPISAL